MTQATDGPNLVLKKNGTSVGFVLLVFHLFNRAPWQSSANCLFSNYWVRMSRIWRILQIKEGVIHLGRRPLEVDNTLRDLQTSSYPRKAEFNNCFLIHSKYIPVFKGVSPFCSFFFCSPKITQPRPQVFLVNGSIICSGLYFWRHLFNQTDFCSNLVNSSWLWWIMRVVLTNQKRGKNWMNNKIFYCIHRRQHN